MKPYYWQPPTYKLFSAFGIEKNFYSSEGLRTGNTVHHALDNDLRFV